LKKLDLYIIRKFLGTFFFILMLLVIIAVVIDFSEKIDNFIRADVETSRIITEYYLTFIPHIAALLGPFFVLVAVVFFTSQLASRSEIIASTSGGVSFYRLMFPYFVGASILAGILYLSNHYWVPDANKTRLYFEENFLRSWKIKWAKGIQRKVDANTVIYMGSYSFEDGIASRFTLEHFDEGRLTYKISANKAIWDDERQVWSIQNFYVREFFEDGTETFERRELMDTTFNVTPKDFDKRISVKEEMTTPELIAFIEAQRKSGQDYIEFYELEKHRRTSSVFSLIILTVIGYSLASKKVRGGIGLHLVAAIIIAGLFELSMKFTTTLTTNSGMHPFLGVWIPNFIFTGVALILIRFAQK
jgi:lipopolysaccharide export system permease protein